MAPKLRLQTRLPHPRSLNLASRPHALALTRTRHQDDTSELQQRLSAVVKRVTGVSVPSSSPNTPSTDDSDDSDYGEEEEEEEADTRRKHREPLASPSSLSSASSYISLASLNPYVVDAEDLAQHLSLLSPSPVGVGVGVEIQDRHEQDSARLARQLDHAHAAVVAEESAALRVLRQQAGLR